MQCFFLSFVLFELVFDLDGRDYNRIRALKKMCFDCYFEYRNDKRKNINTMQILPTKESLFSI
jgi:DNA primase catalytic subunit